MDKEEIEEFALQNKLDVRQVNRYQYRLIKDNIFILDIYFKMNKRKTTIIKNSTLQWRTNKWFSPKSIEELKKLI